jgi:hypothetical protein
MSPASQSVQAGSSASYTVSIAGFNGFAGTVSFTAALACCGNPPFPANATFNPPTVTGSGSTTVTVTTSTSTPPGNYQLIVTGISGSLTHQFGQFLSITNGAPLIALSPASGAGASQSFTVSVTDPAGVNSMDLAFTSTSTGPNTCWLYFDEPSGGLWLASDDASSWTVSYLGSGTTLQNSQCTVPTGGFTVNSNSGTMAITIPITFSSAFTGPKSVYARADDKAGLVTGYEQVGTWSVP